MQFCTPLNMFTFVSFSDLIQTMYLRVGVQDATFVSFSILNTDHVFAGWGARRTHGAILPLAFSSAEVAAEHTYANRHGFALLSGAMLPVSSWEAR